MHSLSFTRQALCLATLSIAAATALAEQDKSIVVEHVQVAPAFEQWASTYVRVPSEAPSATVVTVPWMLGTLTPERTYQPAPVILGLPELPLIGSGAAGAARNWGVSLNYQGLHMQQVVLNAAGTRRTLRAMGSKLQPGERFKLRVTATFDAVAEIEQVLGDPWYGKRSGQVYPQQGMSVKLKAGETLDLPLAANEFFVMDRPSGERLLVSVRHASALGGARSEQPAYRIDGKTGSNYLQLVPRGQYPAIEQVLSQR